MKKSGLDQPLKTLDKGHEDRTKWQRSIHYYGNGQIGLF
jgi:hypothetical protein